jgi:hypothetical protein
VTGSDRVETDTLIFAGACLLILGGIAVKEATR